MILTKRTVSLYLKWTIVYMKLEIQNVNDSILPVKKGANHTNEKF